MPKISNKEYRKLIKDKKALEIFDFTIEYGLQRTHFSKLLLITQSGFQKKMNGQSSFTQSELHVIDEEIIYLKKQFKPVSQTVKGCYTEDESYLDQRRIDLIESGLMAVKGNLIAWLDSQGRQDLIPKELLGILEESQ